MKKLLAAILGVTMCASVATIVPTLASADGETTEKPTVTTAADKDWVVGAGACTLNYELETGYSVIGNLASWGTRAGYNHKVKVDGLTLDLYTDAAGGTNNQTFGISFIDSPTGWALDAAKSFTAHWRPAVSFAQTQTRMTFAKNHDTKEDGLLCYKNADDVYNDAVKPESTFYSSMVWNNTSGELGVRLEFDLIEDKEVYQLTATVTAGTKHGQQPESVVMYFADDWVDSVADENGQVYVKAWGFTNSSDIPSLKVKIEDDNIRAYKAGAYKTTTDALTAYETAATAAAEGKGSFTDAVAAKEAVQATVSALRGNDQTAIEAEIKEVDAILSAAQDNVKAAVQTAYTAADTAIAVLNDEAKIDAENIAAAQEAANNAKASYEEYSAMLSEENKAYFEGLSANYAYALNVANAKLWVIDYETKVNALETTAADALVEAIVAVKADRAAYTGSATETLINGLNETDKAALENRIATADGKLAEKETANAAAVKDYYLDIVEAALAADITIKQNLDDAKAAYAKLVKFVTIAEADGELYTRYTTAYATLKAAAEAYVNGLIEAVDAALVEEYTTLSSFDEAVKNVYKAIDLAYLTEENAEIATAYATLTEKYNANFWSMVTTTGLLADVEQNTTGLYVESNPAFPSRFNYNKALNLKQEGGV